MSGALLLGANNPDFCVLLALACFLETKFSDNHGCSGFVFGDREDDGEGALPAYFEGNLEDGRVQGVV